MQQSTTHAGAAAAAPPIRCRAWPWQKAHVHAKRLVSAPAHLTLLDIAELNGDLRPPLLAIRQIAARRGVSPRTIQRHLNELEKANLLRRVTTKTSWCRNTPNRYILLDVNGDPTHLIRDRNVGEKIKTELKINTPAERPVSMPESRRVENHPPAMRKIFDHNERLQAENRSLRAIVRSKQHNGREYFAYRANLGVYDPSQIPVHTPPSPAELAEAAEYAERERQRDRERRSAADVAAEAERITREARYAADPNARKWDEYQAFLRRAKR